MARMEDGLWIAVRVRLKEIKTKASRRLRAVVERRNMSGEPYESLAKATPRVENVEEDIPFVDDAIKQSDVMEHLKSVDINQEGED